MSYQVLARKWRPKDFSELVGQQQTAQALTNALESQRLHHAYLFTGTRGVGKTTIARILSKSLNCEKGITAQPCGECSSCVEISQGNFVDLLEIDAASKTKVEDTRELLDNVQYRPTRGRYKVYLIDEVHMLSGHSFNALLKTLEEPPPHVIFLLATTDPQKMPVTVLSRCLQFHLRRMEESEIINHLTNILLAEQIQVEDGALEPIAKGADGSMRDALSLLDQAIAYCGGQGVGKQVVLDMLGSIDREYAFRLIAAICDNDAKQLLMTIEDISQYSPDYNELLADWLSLLHQVAIAQAVGDSEDSRVKQLAKTVSVADIQLFYQLSLHAKRDLAYAPHPRQGFEMAMLRILSFKPQTKPLTPGPNNKKNHIAPDISATEQTSQKNSSPVSASVEGNHNLAKEVLNKTEPVAEFSLHQNNVAELKTDDLETDHESAYKEQKSHLSVVVDNDLPKVSNDTVEKKISTVNQVKESAAIATYDTSANELDNTNLEVVKSQLTSSDNAQSNDTAEVITASETYTQIQLDQVTVENWFNVVGGLTIEGGGLQVLLNSTATYESGKLTINYLSKVETLLTENALNSIKADLKSYFSQNDLIIEFNAIEETSETPKVRMMRLYELAIDKAHRKLLSDPQISYMIESLDATLARDSIKLVN